MIIIAVLSGEGGPVYFIEQLVRKNVEENDLNISVYI